LSISVLLLSEIILFILYSRLLKIYYLFYFSSNLFFYPNFYYYSSALWTNVWLIDFCRFFFLLYYKYSCPFSFIFYTVERGVIEVKLGFYILLTSLYFEIFYWGFRRANDILSFRIAFNFYAYFPFFSVNYLIYFYFLILY
jgi:hypothetical protein